MRKEKKPRPSNESTRHILSAKYYPAGRGRRITIQEEFSDFRPKNSGKPPFTWLHAAKKDFQAVAIRQYPNSKPILFPEKLHMGSREISELLASALALYYTTSTSSKSIRKLRTTTGQDNRIRIPMDIKREVMRKLGAWLDYQDVRKSPIKSKRAEKLRKWLRERDENLKQQKSIPVDSAKEISGSTT